VTGDALRITDGIGGRRVASPSPNNVDGGMADPLLVRIRLGPKRPVWADERADLPCKQPDVNPDWWYAPEEFEPDRDGKLPTLPRHAEKAVALCNTCPMRAACELHGLQHEPFGIWGGRNVGVLKVKQRKELTSRVERDQRRKSA
jgi:hypothetical protein